MAFPLPHLYLSIHGTQQNRGAVEDWQTGIRLALSGATVNTTLANVERVVEDCRDDVVEWWVGSNTSGIRSLYTSAVACTHVKGALIATDGSYLIDSSVTRSITLNFRNGGLSGAPPLPAQLSVAATLNTAVNRGLASKGRMYLPAPSAASVSDDGGIQPATVELIANKTARLLDDLNNVPGLDANAALSLRSQVMSKVGNGAARNVVSVGVGRRFDVQRRRAETFPETHFQSSIAVD